MQYKIDCIAMVALHIKGVAENCQICVSKDWYYKFETCLRSLLHVSKGVYKKFDWYMFKT